MHILKSLLKAITIIKTNEQHTKNSYIVFNLHKEEVQ